MRMIAAASVAATLAGSLLFTLGSSPAPAATPTRACVTKAEFNEVTRGMTRARVADIFGTDGSLVLRTTAHGHVYTQRQYPPCPPSSYVSVSFEDLKETGKSARWGMLPAGVVAQPTDSMALHAGGHRVSR